MLSAPGLFLFLKLPFFGYEGATIGHNELSGLWAGQSVDSGVPTSCLPREQTFPLRSPSYLTELCPGGEELRGLAVHPILPELLEFTVEGTALWDKGGRGNPAVCWTSKFRALPPSPQPTIGGRKVGLGVL